MHQISVIWAFFINELINEISRIVGVAKQKSDLKMSVLIMREMMLFYEENYTAGKNITLLPAVLAVTSLTTAPMKYFYFLLKGDPTKCCTINKKNSPCNIVIYRKYLPPPLSVLCKEWAPLITLSSCILIVSSENRRNEEEEKACD